jgi:mevalonate kinase
VRPVTEARAPGKLVIVGEYAVLCGAPGIAVAVNVPAIARLERRPGPDSELLIPDTGERFGFRLAADGTPRWLGQSPGPLGLPLESCIATLAAQGRWPAQLPACRIELDTAAFHRRDAAGQRIKLGLGSSAAVLVALLAVLLDHAGVPQPGQAELIALGCAAHRRLQGGSGSGIDVATAVAGGVISIEAASDTQGPRTTALHWPTGLHLLAIWSGRSASTPVLLARLQDYRSRQAEACAGHMARLGGIAGQTLAAWQGADVPTVLAALERYATALQELDRDADIGIWSGGHTAMRELARAHGAVYKPSGAGGGDFGLALSASAPALAALARDFTARGHHCLEAGFCAPGLAVAGSAQPR